jgi:hypothetical protein
MNYRTAKYRRWNARYQREKRARRRQEQMLTPDHPRVCIGCKKPFLSRQARNVCEVCVQQVWDEAERTTPLRTRKTVRESQLNTMLYRKFGHQYKPSVRPRIPLSEMSVFDMAKFARKR